LRQVNREVTVATSWRTRIEELKPNVKFNPPATLSKLKEAEFALNLQFPSELRELLLETNGVEDWLLSVEEIVQVNRYHRADPQFKEIYASFDELLLFLADGTGSHYAYRVCGDWCDTDAGIIYWLHETDDRDCVGATLLELFKRYLRPIV